MTKIYFEDFVVGVPRKLGTRTITAEEIVAFATQFDPQPFHVDEAKAKSSIFGGLIASGWHSCSIMMRMMCDAYLLDAASMGSPGMDEIRWIKPVRAGDTLRGEGVVLETRVSQSKPDRGIVVSTWNLYNQNDELVMTMRGMGMFGRRLAA